MAIKIMLVEDDINLSEIYQARLQAEGFEIVSAEDGEEALALAVNERPDLIICDVMMPRISGFDMLDILRGTAGIQDTKVIMMTALSQAEDKARAEKLGANRYLVKSQVTLEDVVKTVHEVLGDKPEDVSPEPAQPVHEDMPLDTSAAMTPEKQVLETEIPAAPVASIPAKPVEIVNDQTTTTEQTAVLSQIKDFEDEVDSKDAADNTVTQTPEATSSTTSNDGHSMNKVIEPVVPTPQTDIHALVNAEENKASNTVEKIDDIVPKPQNSPAPTVNPVEKDEPELDPNQIAL